MTDIKLLTFPIQHGLNQLFAHILHKYFPQVQQSTSQLAITITPEYFLIESLHQSIAKLFLRELPLICEHLDRQWVHSTKNRIQVSRVNGV